MKRSQHSLVQHIKPNYTGVMCENRFPCRGTQAAFDKPDNVHFHSA